MEDLISKLDRLRCYVSRDEVVGGVCSGLLNRSKCSAGGFR